MTLRYTDIIQIPTFEERYKLLARQAIIGERTFGGYRPLNQEFYRSKQWKNIRNAVIVRDGACDLAHPDYLLENGLVIHHINPISIESLLSGSMDSLFNLENLILTSEKTHRAIHFGDGNIPYGQWAERRPNDTCPWK